MGDSFIRNRSERTRGQNSGSCRAFKLYLSRYGGNVVQKGTQNRPEQRRLADYTVYMKVRKVCLVFIKLIRAVHKWVGSRDGMKKDLR